MPEPSTSHDASVSRHALGLVADYLDATASQIHRRLGATAGVAVTYGDAGEPRTIGASTELAADLDRTQVALGEGPCLDVLRGGATTYVPDLGDAPAWPAYGPLAVERGAASCVSVPVRVGGATAAVFKVYADRVDGLDADQRATAEVVAAELAGGVALAGHLTRLAAELDDMTAMAVHRRAIDLALGISMERAQVDAEAAFALLRRQSQHRNVKLHDVAAEVVESVRGAGGGDLVPPFNPRG